MELNVSAERPVNTRKKLPNPFYVVADEGNHGKKSFINVIKMNLLNDCLLKKKHMLMFLLLLFMNDQILNVHEQWKKVVDEGS